MTAETSPKYILQQMFSEMVVKKDDSQITHYYHPDFLLFTNGQVQDYKSFAKGHSRIYATPISYKVTYDDDTWIESKAKVAVRCWITTHLPGNDAVQYEVMLIATFVDSKIYRLWELTWPDWSSASSFKEYHKPGGSELAGSTGD